ncbi:cryptochrome/photolyase family protein [Pseudahrensia aquimaris]|uniref:Cryptochrome/photolyase family protein n=1 Tax=Pseudahrensia aquimaris TaxID=744461 RepID=A0ABW3FBM7_9HYPH
MKKAALIFPHQLYDDHPALEGVSKVLLLEEPLFFRDPTYPAKMHKQKLAYHRTTMTHYAQSMKDSGVDVRHIETREEADFVSVELGKLVEDGVSDIVVCDVHDFTLNKRLRKAAEAHGLTLEVLDSPAFINTPELNADYRAGKKRWFMADYYKFQRKRLKVMVDDDGEPEGGQWSFDEDNRKKVPKKLLGSLPHIPMRKGDDVDAASQEWVEANFADNPGALNTLVYPVTHKQAQTWLQAFLEERFHDFGPYEDAILEGESWLWHSVLTPMLNTGLLTPRQIINETLAFAQKNEVPLNSLEGFIRQIIGWREFMRATYDDLGVKMRTTNHWNHMRKLPDSFYDGTTGVLPVDDAIKRLNETAYCHHIERLMVLGGFMFLCEIDPDDIYRWFMEMFIDSYDWVMVPNVYAMSQNADGGLITTKPYFSGSAYVKKMSHYTGKENEGEWATIWDGLYWRWINKHKDELSKNPRWAMMCAQVRKMDEAKLQGHLERSETFLKGL